MIRRLSPKTRAYEYSPCAEHFLVVSGHVHFCDIIVAFLTPQKSSKKSSKKLHAGFSVTHTDIMQATTLADVTDNNFLFNIIAHQIELKDLQGLALTTQTYRTALPHSHPLWRYTLDWHTMDMPTSNREDLQGPQWVWNADLREAYQVPRDLWKTIFMSNDIAAATSLLKCDALMEIPEPDEDEGEYYYTSHNAVQVHELAWVQTVEMLTLLSKELYLEGHMKWKIGDDRSRDPRYGRDTSHCTHCGDCWHNPGFTLDYYSLELYTFAGEVGRGEQMLAMLHQLGCTNRAIAEKIEDIETDDDDEELEDNVCTRFFDIFGDSDPVMQELQQVDLLCRLEWYNPYSTLVSHLHPFHIMAAGYDSDDEDSVLGCFREFMDYDVDTRNEDGGDGHDYMTVLEIVYKTRPLNRNLLVILNQMKHNEVVFFN